VLGSRPRHQAGNATDARCDFRWRPSDAPCWTAAHSRVLADPSDLSRDAERMDLIDGFRRARGLSLEPGNEPGAGRARGRIRPIDRLETIGPPLQLGHIELDEPPFFEILAHHRFGHIAPTDARPE
jgi:hypothetical protein